MNLPKAKVKQFILSGRAIVTVLNNQTHNHKTFKIRQSDDKKVWFVSIRGDRDSIKDDKKNWIYMGMILGHNFLHTRSAKVSPSSLSFRAFKWMFDQLPNWEKGIDPYPFVDVRHEGRCGRCGRPLTDPDSIQRGFGPECIQKLGG